MVRQSENEQIIILYDDHRWILNVLFKIYRDQLIDNPNLVYFDAHDDAAQSPSLSRILKAIGVSDISKATEKQFGAFVDYDCRYDDGGWLATALELNLIQDVVNIGNRHSDNIERMNGCYKSEDGTIHRIFMLSENIEYELGPRGQLGDTTLEDECRGLRDFFGIEHFFQHHIEIAAPYILDFDLDFFTMSFSDERSHGWTERVLESHFPQFSPQLLFVRELIRDAQVITICREPDYCGSVGDSNRILSMLDKYFFEGCIGTDVTL